MAVSSFIAAYQDLLERKNPDWTWNRLILVATGMMKREPVQPDLSNAVARSNHDHAHFAL
jgi:hypothetical protein